ncbi:MAG: hypothetical protein IPO73_10990 [Gemmatimonadetes bacterium]|nr:hypothetical protein [Gemmatimonadota bacterium]
MAAALVDRLVHHCHIVNIRGNSYRLRQHRDLRPAASRPTPPLAAGRPPAEAPRPHRGGAPTRVPDSPATSVPHSIGIDTGQ